jgi:integrase
MKKILTYATDGRWRKQIDGKMYYFGKGKSKSDSRSYAKAENKYFEFLAKRSQSRGIEKRVSDLTFMEFGEKFLQNNFSRYERNEISASWFEKVRISVDAFVEFIGPKHALANLCEMDLEDYRASVLSLPVSDQTNKPISPWTAKSRLDIVRQLIRWGYKMALIETLPRNLDGYAKITIPEPTVNRFSREEINILYSAASERVKIYMLLALNTGMGQTDISSLRVSEIHMSDKRIVRKRTKTGVHCEFALWPLTVEMLKLHGNLDSEPNDRVFLSNSGHPLVREYFIDDKFKRTDAIRSAFFRLMKKTKTPNHRGFYSLRKTAASEIETIDPAVTEMFLGHSEKGLKRHYAERDWARLDGAILKLGNIFQLV